MTLVQLSVIGVIVFPAMLVVCKLPCHDYTYVNHVMFSFFPQYRIF